MGFPYDTPTWDGVSGVIFVGGVSGPTLIYSILAIAICIAALLYGNSVESSKYKKHK